MRIAKGIILGGGTGSRLYPVTFAVNKHLLSIYNKPMIYYPLSVLALAGIRDVLLICDENSRPMYEKLLGDGSRFGMNISYRVQEKPLGLAHGLLMGKEFANSEPVCMILGDNIFYGHSLQKILMEAREKVEREGGAVVFAYPVRDPERYGVVVFNEEGRATDLFEKPKNPPSHWAVTGLYFYDPTCFEKAERIEPSDRGEYEITSVNEEYLKEGKLFVKKLGRGFAWFDAGTHESFLEASNFVATVEHRTGYMIGCLEEIAYRNGWISKEDLLERARELGKTAYGRYLEKIAREEEDAFFFQAP